MRTDVYQAAAMRTCRNPKGSTQAILEAALGLNGEAGEVADLVKKSVFGGHPLDREKLILKLGDVLWYIAEAASGLDTTLDEIMGRNIAKLEARYPTGKFSTEDSIARRDTHENNSRS